MSRIILNHEIEPPANACHTWGELLDVLDERCAARGEVVTVARFDGVEQPIFREAEILGLQLRNIAIIEVESTPPRALLLSTLEQADRAVAALHEAAERLGESFRGFDVSAANEELVQFAESLGTVVSLAGALSLAIGLTLDQVECEGTTGAQLIAEMTGFTDGLIGAQSIGDWITVADIVEYDVAPALRRWPALFDALRRSVPGTIAAALSR